MRYEEFPNFMTVAEFSKLVNVSIKTTYKEIADGKIRALRVRNAIRIPRGELLRLLGVSVEDGPKILCN